MVELGVHWIFGALLVVRLSIPVTERSRLVSEHLIALGYSLFVSFLPGGPRSSFVTLEHSGALRIVSS